MFNENPVHGCGDASAHGPSSKVNAEENKDKNEDDAGVYCHLHINLSSCSGRLSSLTSESLLGEEERPRATEKAAREQGTENGFPAFSASPGRPD